MYTLTWENLRDVTEKCMGDSVYMRHALYALHFLVENVYVPIGMCDIYTTTDADTLTSGLFQKIVGKDLTYYLALVDLREGLRAIAKGFAGDEYEDDKSFIFDASGELINRINGEYVITEAKDGIDLTMEPQLFLEEDEAREQIKFREILHIPISIGASNAEMLFVTV